MGKTKNNTSEKTVTVEATGKNVVGDRVAELESLKTRGTPAWVKALLAVLLVVVLAVVGVLFVKNTTGGQGAHTEAQTTQVSRSVTGKSVDEDKRDALNALTGLLNEASTPGGQDYRERAKTIEGGDYSSLPEGWREKMVSAEDKGKVAGWEALIVLNAGMREYFKTEGEVKPVSDSAVNYVVVNPEAGVAHIPGSVFLGADVPMSFDMVFVDGQWRLDPYNVVQDILNSAAAGAQSSAANPVEPQKQ